MARRMPDDETWRWAVKYLEDLVVSETRDTEPVMGVEA